MYLPAFAQFRTYLVGFHQLKLVKKSIGWFLGLYREGKKAIFTPQLSDE
jgi:hypothetical protein